MAFTKCRLLLRFIHACSGKVEVLRVSSWFRVFSATLVGLCITGVWRYLRGFHKSSDAMILGGLVDDHLLGSLEYHGGF